MGEDENGFRNYFEMLETLAENRDLQTNIEEAEKMLTEVDITKFASYRWGMKAGLAQGIEQGEKRKAMDIVHNLLRLGTLSDEDIARITGTSLEDIRALRSKH